MWACESWDKGLEFHNLTSLLGTDWTVASPIWTAAVSAKDLKIISGKQLCREQIIPLLIIPSLINKWSYPLRISGKYLRIPTDVSQWERRHSDK